MTATTITGLGYEDIAVGQTAEFSRQLTEELVELFAAVSGDLNPVHLDAEFAASTPFGERIGHGAWVSSVISAAIAMQLPGPGAIYRSQQIRFKEPVKMGDTVTVLLEVTEKKDRMRLLMLDCKVTNQHGKLVAQGIAEVIAPGEAQTVVKPECPAFNKVN